MGETGTLQIISKKGKNYRGSITIPIKAPVQHGWEISLQFNEPIRILSSWKAKTTHLSQSRYTMENKVMNSILNTGTTLKINFQAKLFNIHRNPEAIVTFKRKPEAQNCSQNATVEIFERWPVAFKATISVLVPVDVQEWKIHLTFSKNVSLLQVPKATYVKINETYFILTRASWDKKTLKQEDKLKIEFIAYARGRLPRITALFTWKGTCIATSQPPTQISSTDQPPTYVSSTKKYSTLVPSTDQPSTYVSSTGQPSTYVPSTDLQSSTYVPSAGQTSTYVPSTGQPEARNCSQNATVDIFERWPVALKATISVVVPLDVQEWKIHLTFSKNVSLLQVPKATYVKINETYFILTRASWDIKTLKQGDKLKIEFIAYARGRLPRITALFTWKGTCIATSQPPTQISSIDQPPTYVSPTEKNSTIIPSTDQSSTIVPSTGQPSTYIPLTDQSSTYVSLTRQPSTYIPSTDLQSSTYVPSTGQPEARNCSQNATVEIFERWPVAFKATISVVARVDVEEWNIHLIFSKNVSLLQVPKATYVKINETNFIITRASWDKKTLKQGDKLKIEFIAYARGRLPRITALFTWKGTSIATSQISCTNPSPTYVSSTEKNTTLVPPTEQPPTNIPSTDQLSTHVPSAGQPSTYIPSTDLQSSTYVPSTGQPEAQNCSQNATVEIFERWPIALKATISVVAPVDVQEWKIHLTFSKNVSLLQVPKATYVKINETYFIITRASWDKKTLKQGDKLKIEFIAYARGRLPRITALFTWKGTCIATSQPPTQISSTGQPPTYVSSTENVSTLVHSTGQPSTYIPSTEQSSTYAPLTGQPEARNCSQNATVDIFERWPVALKATISVVVPVDVQEWKIHLIFSKNVSLLQVPKATYVKINETYSTLTRASWDKKTLKQGDKLKIEFIAYARGRLPRITALFTWKGTCIATSQPPTQISSTGQPPTYVFSTENVSTLVPSTGQPSTYIPSTEQSSTYAPLTGQPEARNCSQNATVDIFERWPVALKATISVVVPVDVQEWKIHLIFSKNVSLLQVPKATYVKINETYFILTRASWDKKTLKQGDKLKIEFIAYARGRLSRITALFTWKGTCIATSQPSTQISSTNQPPTYVSSTENQSTHVPSTGQPSTYTPSTDKSSTYVPLTDQLPTYVSSTDNNSTLVPSTEQPSTYRPLTGHPSTYIPSTKLPSTQKSSTHVPSTQETPTYVSSTRKSSTNQLSTQKLPTFIPSTQSPSYLTSTSLPLTKPLSTSEPSTREPSTYKPLTGQPSTHIPSTEQQSTYVPSTQKPSAAIPSTRPVSISRPWTGQPSTGQQSTYIASTQRTTSYTPFTRQPSTYKPSTISSYRQSTGQPSTYIPSTWKSSTNVLSTNYPSLIPTSSKDCGETASFVDEKTGKMKISVLVVEDWPVGFKATMRMNISEDIVEGWEIRLFFASTIKDLTVWRVVPPSLRIGTKFVLKSMPWNKVLKKGTILEVSFLAFKINTAAVPNMCAVFVWKRNSPLPSSLPTTHLSTVTTNQLTTKSPSSAPSSFSTKQPTVEISTKETIFATPSTTYKPSLKYPYNYNEVLQKSILFYEAQRSGVLPPTNRISWRRNSALQDQGENGEDLVGGWYDAGDHVKFGFPMAFSTTLLTWGLLEYRDAYVKSGQLQHMLDCIKWPLDYFIKAHVKSDVFYGQVMFSYRHLHILDYSKSDKHIAC